MGEPKGWPRRVEEFALANIRDPPARVLGMGCGKGELAFALDRAGHRVRAIDQRAPERATDGPVFRRMGIEGLSDPEPFDHILASVSLHHVGDLGAALDKLAGLLCVGGPLAWSSSRGTGWTRLRHGGL